MKAERWSLARATSDFEELLEQVITTRKPIFVVGERRTVVLISMEEWGLTPDKLSSRALSDL